MLLERVESTNQGLPDIISIGGTAEFILIKLHIHAEWTIILGLLTIMTTLTTRRMVVQEEIMT